MLRSCIHALERAQWARESRRLSRPFEWGIEHLGGDPARDDPRSFLLKYSDVVTDASESFFDAGTAESYQLEADRLSFPSAVRSIFPENNTVSARWFPADRPHGKAVLVLPHWNAEEENYVAICRWLQFLGVSALRLSMPYHDKRKVPGCARADLMVSPNIGLTLQATRQAVADVRRAVRWLEKESYTRIGILGTSMGSSIAYIALAHEPALEAGAFLHMSTHFADVVRLGLTTAHVWEIISRQVSADELRQFWAPISAFPYIKRLKNRNLQILIISARYDLSFPFELSCQLFRAMEEQCISHRKLILPCGHYSLGIPPFSWWAGIHFIPFLHGALSRRNESRNPEFAERSE